MKTVSARVFCGRGPISSGARAGNRKYTRLFALSRELLIVTSSQRSPLFVATLPNGAGLQPLAAGQPQAIPLASQSSTHVTRPFADFPLSRLSRRPELKTRRKLVVLSY